MAIADDCIRKNPFDFKLATVIKRDVTEREPLSREQVDALLGFMRSDAVYHRYIDEVVILLGTGLRISEMCGLTEADIDLTNRVIFVDHQLARAVGGGYRVDEPKTESGRRYIYMTDEVMAAFEHVMASRPKAKPLNVDGRLHLPQQGRAAEGRRRLRPGVQGAERQVREEGKDGASRWHDTAYAASHVLHGDGEGRDEPEGAAIHHGP